MSSIQPEENESEQFREEFSLLGLSPPQAIIDKCIELCHTYGLTPEMFMGEWVAFSVTHLNGDTDPTYVNLRKLETRSLKEKETVVPKVQRETSTYVHVDEDDDEHDKILLDSYNLEPSKSEKSAGQKRLLSPASEKLKPAAKKLPPAEGGTATFYPAGSKYAERTDQGQVQLTFGPSERLGHEDATDQEDSARLVEVQLCKRQTALTGEANRYMYSTTSQRRDATDDIIDHLGHQIIKKHFLEEPESFVKFTVENVTTYGRVCCPRNRKLNPTNVYVETSSRFGQGRRSEILLNGLKDCSLFPGQVVAMRTRANVDTLIPEAVYSDAALAPQPLAAQQEPLRIVVAAGPYTPSDSTDYQPLQDLLDHVTSEKPDLVILIGPFLDVDHDSVKDNTLEESFDKFFDKLIERIMASVEGLKKTQLVLVASLRDVTHHCVYPTPPYELCKQYERLHVHPDPSMFQVDGVTIGVTSVDVLFHLNKKELAWQVSKSDRMSRIVSHLMSQQSFYPLCPAEPDINLDTCLLELQATWECAPHILLLPSNLKHFVKNIDGCVVINPERLTKYCVGGTFATIHVLPAAKGTSVADNVICKIIKI